MTCLIAGSRTTEDCKPRQVRKEAAVAKPTCVTGKPGYHLLHSRLKGNRLKTEGKNMRDRKLLKAIKLAYDSYPSVFGL